MPNGAAGTLILCEPTIAAREATAARVAAETGATFIPPYDYGPVMAGQGTIGLELLQQVGPGCRMMHHSKDTISYQQLTRPVVPYL